MNIRTLSAYFAHLFLLVVVIAGLRFQPKIVGGMLLFFALIWSICTVIEYWGDLDYERRR